MNQQTTFSRVVKHLLTQNVKAQKGDESGRICLYRAPSGLKCAAGCLIPDKVYNPDMESKSTTYLLTTWPKFRALFDFEPDFFLRRLQFCHDRGDVKEWPGRLREIATEFKLKLPPILRERIT